MPHTFIPHASGRGKGWGWGEEGRGSAGVFFKDTLKPWCAIRMYVRICNPIPMVYRINSTSSEGDNFMRQSRVKFTLSTSAINPL